MLHSQGDWSDLEVLAQVLGFLRQKLARQYRHIDEHWLDASVEDAMLRHLARPEGFDASRGGSLLSYLALWSRSYLDRRLRKEKRRRKHEKAVGISDEVFETIASEKRAERSIYPGRERREQEVEEWREALDAIMGHLNTNDRVEMELLRDGASFEQWVRRLGIEQLPLEEQRHKAYAEKDRLMKKLKRLAQKLQGRG